MPGGFILGVCGRGWQRFQHDERGVILIIFSLLIVPLLLIVGVAIDFGQSLVVKHQLAAAADAAALSISAEPNLDDAEARQKAEDYIHAHYPDAAIGKLTSFTVTRDKDTIDVSATAQFDTSFLRFAGYNALDVTVNSRVLRKQNKLEVVMVLDNTGSMAGAKIAALKTAANELVDTLFGSDEESTYVKIGLVPFTNAVNIGMSRRGAAWLDEATPAAINGEQLTDGGATVSLLRFFEALNVSWTGCVRSRTEPFDLTDEPPDPADRRTLFTPYLAPDEPCTSTRTCPNLDNDYLSGDRAPRKFLSDYRNRSNVPASGPNHYCPNAIQDLTNVKSTITSAIDAMVANGPTVIPEGIAWGWRLISPGPPFTGGAPYSDQDTIKAVIVLTDGDNNVSPNSNGAYNSVFSSYGYVGDGKHLGAADGSQADAVLNEKTAQVCENIKADKDGDPTDQDIVVYTIVFGGGVSFDTEKMMRECASDPSKYFSSPRVDDLHGAFESIALGLNRLRVAM